MEAKAEVEMKGNRSKLACLWPRPRIQNDASISRVAWLMLLLILSVNTVHSSAFSDQSKPMPRWREQLEKRTQLLASIENTPDRTTVLQSLSHSLPHSGDSTNSLRQNRRRQNEAGTTPLARDSRAQDASHNNRKTMTAHAQTHTSDFPHRVRIAAFDLLIAPTPTKLQRVDEDLLLVALQELAIKFMKMQFGNEEIAANRVGKDTTVEYVLFSDIEGNTWSEGHSGPNDPPRTILEFNGGVASFVGPNIPSEDEVNEWVETAVNGLFVSTLTETPYSYVELTQYMSESLTNEALQPADIVVNVAETDAPKPIQQPVQEPILQSTTPLDGEPGTALFNILVSLLVGFVVIALLLVLWIRWNNRAVRILCLSGKDNEEVVDFTDDDQISIAHNETAAPRTNPEKCTDNNDDNADTDDTGPAEGHKKISFAKLNNSDEHSSTSSISELTIPAVSALSFQTPNPFTKNMASRESFQKEREKNYLSKDMLYSSWAGKAPTIPSTRKRDHRDHSVLQSSYFSAKKEREAMAWMTNTTSSFERRSAPGGGSEEVEEFQFEAANEKDDNDGQPDGLYTITDKIRRSRQVLANQGSGSRGRESSDFV
ncbi:expressed unknown protein [Seminavis robusta]|uniref:Uncharacterized protein n=1 Tax=Seminavis robusta TaxID=568900 RepID=A0A9N8DV43_9STRA|nr:expressed unknown protein [Seminavis robusta]|eukprot:Sro305_g112780.1 n/a (599) ;mRNA; f:45971-47853